MSSKFKGNIILLITSLIWGISFVSQSVGVKTLSPAAFNGIRTILGALVLVPVIFATDFVKKKNNTYHSEKKNKYLWLGGLVCGTALCAASTVQTYGLVYTTAGKGGFITALYILFVPIIGIFLGKRPGINVLIGILLSLAGMYFLCLFGTDLTMNKGDAIIIVCAILFAVHIICVDYFSPRADGTKLACLQFFVSGTINIIMMLMSDTPTIQDVLSCAVPILYSGVMSCGVAYTLQIIGQKYTEPTIASILMSFESVFSVLAGWLILKDALSPAEGFGCVLMFSAIIVAQLPRKFYKFPVKNQTNV